MQSIRIFVSSPNDVWEEREKAKSVIAALQARYYQQATLIPVLWEDLAIPATASFQEGIDFVLAKKHPIDIAVFILWTRLGSPIGAALAKADGSPYRSGTEREFDLMLAAFEQSGRSRPCILAYTRRDDEGFNERLDARQRGDDDLEEMLRQRRLVKDFISEHFQDDRGRNLRAYHTYTEPVGFAQRLHVHLRDQLDTLLQVDSSTVSWTEAPYRSLEFFDIAHAPIFCGRDEETCDLLQHLRDQELGGCAFVCIVGASGAGKSSLARAGLAATLIHRSFDDGVKAWRAAVFIPSLDGDDLFLGLARTVAGQVPELEGGVGGLTRFAERLGENHEAAGDLLDAAIARAELRLGGVLRVLLIVDQMEELWTHREVTEEQRENFLATVEMLARHGRFSVVATLRSDFYPQAQLSTTFLRMKAVRGHFDLTPPGTAALQQLILQPARRAGLRFERDEVTGRRLEQRILEDAVSDPAALPLLQFALRELYERRDVASHLLTFKAYEAMDGVEGALAQRAAETFERLPAEAQEALEELLPLLVSVDLSGEQSAVRRRAAIADLTRTPARARLTAELIAARFLTSDEHEHAPIASLTHEALLRRWDRVKLWIDNNRDYLRMRTQVEQSQRRWEKASAAGDPSTESLLLAPGLPLDEGRRLLSETDGFVEAGTSEYIRRSIARHLRIAMETGKDLFACAAEIEAAHPDVWHEVVASAFGSGEASTRRNAAALIGKRRERAFMDELIRLVLSDPDESVRQTAAQALVSIGEIWAFDRIASGVHSAMRSQSTATSRRALARLLAVADMQPVRPTFADWFPRLRAGERMSIRMQSRWIRLRKSLHVFLFLVIPAALFAVVGAASIKWLPSSFNYSCVQSSPSAFMGLFYSGPAGLLLGGGISVGVTLYRIVFGREYDPTSMLRPFPAILFGALFGLASGLACTLMISLVYTPEALQQIGWIPEATRPSIPELLRELFVVNRCGYAFPLTSLGLGIAVGLVTNSLRASKKWPEFVNRQTALTSLEQLWRVFRGLVRVTIGHSLPILLAVPLFAALGLVVMNSVKDHPSWSFAPLRVTLLGGLDEPMPAEVRDDPAARREFEQDQVARRIEWKVSSGGRAMGLFGDALSKIVGGYFIILGMGLGIVILRHGVQIAPQRTQR